LNKTILLLFTIATFLIAQDFTGISIYINPGHGGHDPANDRYIPETGFWESEGNLEKGLRLRDILLSLNATIKMSRITNNDGDDLGLSTISADANNFDADFFHSIHSNGFQGTSNYTLMLYKEVNGLPAFQDAKDMCDIMANTIYQAHRTTTKYTRGDESFLGFNLGVLRNLTMPGTLSEGSFHDYIPESWRLKNNAYLKHEAWAITKAFIDYFNLTPLPYGEIAGILRDPFDNVDYFYISSTSDAKKPLNFSIATLLPDNKQYLGDALNNGFYMLDEVPPGTYDLILEAEDYKADTVFSVVVSANKTTFIDRSLIPKPNLSPPVIINYSPEQEENVRLNSEFIYEFNVKMDRTSVQQSFSITPNVIGAFTWESNDKKMVFSPVDFLEPGTEYEVTIASSAKSFYNVLIENTFSHTFSTRSALKLVDSYPAQNSEEISTTVKIKLLFDAPIDDFSLGGNVIFQDIDGNDINLYIDEIDYDNGKIIFEPLNPLENKKFYQVKLLNGIKDVEGSNLSSDTTIIFKTEAYDVVDGTTILDFEDISVWWQPEQSGSTNGIDIDKTSFIISTKRAIDGTHSGKLTYAFNIDSGGVCRVYNEFEPKIPTNTNSVFGMWVFGDYSYNYLEYWFRNNDGTNIPIFIDTLNWTGYKFKEVDLSGYGELAFHSMVIEQNSLGEKNGQVHFDVMQSDLFVTDIKFNNELLPTEYKLEQNYPNPFNPTTTIRYSIPQRSFIQSEVEGASLQLKIYDVLGRVVATLVKKQQKPGNYEITFDASEFSSGVYYYQLKTSDYLETKKMLLLK